MGGERGKGDAHTKNDTVCSSAGDASCPSESLESLRASESLWPGQATRIPGHVHMEIITVGFQVNVLFFLLITSKFCLIYLYCFVRRPKNQDR